MMNSPIVIVGGGVIGLSIAWHLSQFQTNPKTSSSIQNSKDIIVIDKGRVGREASWAAAGMIAPFSEAIYQEEHLLPLFRASHELYPEFIQSLEKASGQKIDFKSPGSLLVALDQDDALELKRFYDYQQKLKLPSSWISPTEVLELEPGLTPHLQAAVQVPQESYIDNRQLVTILKHVLEKDPRVRLIENQNVTGLNMNHGEIQSIQVGSESILTNHVVLATGVDQDIPGWPEEIKIPLRGVKGQAALVQLHQQVELKHMIRSFHRYPVYLVPRGKNQIVIGATQEEKDQEDQIKTGNLMDLLYATWKVFPHTEETEFLESWVGFRPTTKDHAPVLGATPYKGLSLALGMYRHGILLTPLVGQLMAEAILNQPSHFLSEYGWQRFNPH